MGDGSTGDVLHDSRNSQRARGGWGERVHLSMAAGGGEEKWKEEKDIEKKEKKMGKKKEKCIVPLRNPRLSSLFLLSQRRG